VTTNIAAAPRAASIKPENHEAKLEGIKTTLP
jgi:hypothetical protein